MVELLAVAAIAVTVLIYLAGVSDERSAAAARPSAALGRNPLG